MWEYKIFTWNSANIFDREQGLENNLNNLGKRRWEVISAISTKFHCGDNGTEQTDEVVFLLKRPVE